MLFSAQFRHGVVFRLRGRGDDAFHVFLSGCGEAYQPDSPVSFGFFKRKVPQLPEFFDGGADGLLRGGEAFANPSLRAAALSEIDDIQNKQLFGG